MISPTGTVSLGLVEPIRAVRPAPVIAWSAAWRRRPDSAGTWT